jgi:arylsulfatase A-like enzyme
VSFHWTSERNRYGVPGAHTINSGTTGHLAGDASGHGGLSPWVVRNTLVAWGADFKTGARTDAPASLADVMPTVLAVLGVDNARCSRGCGRVLREALKDGPPATMKTSRRVVSTRAGAYRALVEMSTIDRHDYVDSGSRQK